MSPYPIKVPGFSAALRIVGNVGVLVINYGLMMPVQEFLAQLKIESHLSRLGETDESLYNLLCRGATNGCEAIRFTSEPLEFHPKRYTDRNPNVVKARVRWEIYLFPCYSLVACIHLMQGMKQCPRLRPAVHLEVR